MKMFFYKMLMLCLFFSGLQVHGQFFTMDVTGSGDGLNDSSTYSRLPLIDDNGDISTAVTGINGIKTVDETEANFTDTALFSTSTPVEETTVNAIVNDAFTDSTVMQNSETTESVTDSTTTERGTSDILVDSTTTSVLTVSSNMETTTQETTTTEEDSTTTETTTTAKTTRKPIKTDSATEMPESESKPKPKPKEMVTKSPSTTIPTSTFQIAEDADKRCTFMDDELVCNVEIICYGSGEIDCTDDEEMDGDYSDVPGKRPSSFPDYDNITEGETNPLALRQLFFNAHKIDFFKMFPLTPTDNESSSEEIEEMTTTGMPFSDFTLPENDELPAEENVQMNDTMDAADIESILDAEVFEKFDSFLPPTESTETHKIFYDGEIPSFNDNSSNTESSADLEGMENDRLITPKFFNDFEMENSSQINETTIHQDYYTNNETLAESVVTNADMKTSSVWEKVLPQNGTRKDDENQPIIVRTKRENNGNANYKMSELEGSKKKINFKACRLSGNLVCTPRPTSFTCSGKTFCQALPEAVETVEKPAQEKGLGKWTIAVIIICAVTAGATIFLLIYLVVTSYKKLKVQPQNGVTTLNYVNNAQP